MGDPIISSTPQVQTINTVPQVTTAPKSSGFGRVLGGVLGGALNFVAPGLGSLIGGGTKSCRCR